MECLGSFSFWESLVKKVSQTHDVLSFSTAWHLFHFLFLSFPSIFNKITPIFPHSYLVSSNSNINISNEDQDSPKQTAVVLMNGKSHEPGSTATMCLDVNPGKALKQHDWLSLLRASTVNNRPHSSLKFSMSLNDVGQRVDSLYRGLNFIDRTCSEGELGAKAKQLSVNGQKVHNGKLTSENSNQSFLVPSLTNNYKYMLAVPPANSLLVAQPQIPNPHPNHSQSSNFLRRFLPFSRSSTSTSLGSLASHLHVTKSSSTLPGSAEPSLIHDVYGDDDVFEEERKVPNEPLQLPGLSIVHAPMCYMEEDTDLDGCPTPMSEKEPQSPFSLSGDCCRWVVGRVETSCRVQPTPYCAVVGWLSRDIV